MKTIGFFAFVLLVLSACTSSKHAPYPSDFSVQKKGLECGRIFITSSGTEISRRAFFYGEKINVHFEGLIGLKGKGNLFHPGMEVSVTNEQGEKVLYNKDLYANNNSIRLRELDLTAFFSVGKPIVEDGKYKVKIHIWDKDGTGTLDLSFNCSVISNDKIVAKTTGPIEYTRVYLFDNDGDSAIASNTVQPGQRVYVMIEGLKGFTEKNGKVKIGMGLEVTDAQGKRLLNSKDLIGDDLYDPEVVAAQAQANFVMKIVPPGPIKVRFNVYDKQGNSKIEVSTELNGK